MHAAARFIAELLLITQVDRRRRKLAIIANRTRQNTKSYRMLMRFLNSLDIPVIVLAMQDHGQPWGLMMDSATRHGFTVELYGPRLNEHLAAIGKLPDLEKAFHRRR